MRTPVQIDVVSEENYCRSENPYFSEARKTRSGKLSASEKKLNRLIHHENVCECVLYEKCDISNGLLIPRRISLEYLIKAFSFVQSLRKSFSIFSPRPYLNNFSRSQTFHSLVMNRRYSYTDELRANLRKMHRFETADASIFYEIKFGHSQSETSNGIR